MAPNDILFEGGGGGILVQPQQQAKSVVDNASAIRQSGNPDLEVTRYALTWSLIPSDDGASPIIRTEMEIDFSASNGATYGKAFKSIASSTVKNVVVVQTGTALRQNTFERDGYQFVEWWFIEPLTSKARILITYDIHDGVAGCATNVYCNSFGCIPSEEVSDYDADSSYLMPGTCSESFSASWANLWKVPVANVTYRFILPGEDTFSTQYIDYSLFLKSTEEPSEGASCTYYRIQNLQVNSNGKQQYYVECEQLDTNRMTSPDRPTFTWYLNNSSDGSLSHCRNECSSSGGPLTYVQIGVIIVFTLIGFVLLALCVRKGNGYMRRRGQASGQPQRGRMNEVNATERTTPTEKNNVITNEEVEQLPLIQFGAAEADVEAVIEKYNRTFKTTAKSDPYTEEEEHTHNHKTNNFGQKVAFSACDSCSICICDLKEGEQVRLLPHCGHVFHNDCIKQWLTEQKRSCPLCQEIVG
jgi:hypothetical protein